MRYSASLILIALAVADTLVLWVSLPEHFFIEMWDIYFEGGKVGCSLYRFLNVAVVTNAIYLLVLFTVFRVVAVCWVHKASLYCSPKRAYIAIATVAFLSCLRAVEALVISKFYTSASESGEFGENECAIHEKYLEYEIKHQSILALFLSSIIPFSIILFSNVFYAVRIKQLQMRSDPEGNSPYAPPHSHVLTAFFFSISLLFLFSTTPRIITNIIQRRMDESKYTEEYLYKFYFVETCTKLLSYLNNVGNFWCYYVSGARFRSEFVAMFKRGGGDTGGDSPSNTLYLSTAASTANIVASPGGGRAPADPT